MNFLSVCSGIEAASVAFHPLGWKAVAFAEIEPFPCALLKHRYPNVPNLGDLRRFMEWPVCLLVQVDILVGGTPCQAFSVAGLRQSLTDDRGNLTLIFCLLYAHICKIRHAAGRPAPLFLWENVPGVLNTPDNAFGCFLAGLAGENGALRPPGGKWLDAGYVRGPIGSIAWRTLDAQYFGVAQRRERVFALGSVDPAFNPAEVLFEFDSLRRDSAPSREQGKDTTCGTLRSTDGGVHVGHAQANQLCAVGIERVAAESLPSEKEAPESQDSGVQLPQSPFNPNGVCPTITTHPYGDDLIDGGKLVPEVAWAIQARDAKGSDSNTKRGHLIPEVCPTLLGGGNSTGGHRPPGSTVDNCESLIPEQLAFKTLPPAIAFSVRMRGDDGRGYDRPPLVFGEEVVGAIDTMKPHCVAFPEKMSGTQCASSTDLSPVLQSHNTTAVDFQTRIARNGRGDMGELVNALQAQSGHSGKGDAAPCVAVQEAVAFKPRHYRLPNKDGAAAEISGPLTANMEHAGDCSPHAAYSDGVAWRVRRLTPEECEILQGFPLGYTLIPGYSVKLRKGADLAQTIEYLRAVMPTVAEVYLVELAHSPDGPRYKALGNSWAVPCVRWIGARIDARMRPKSLPLTPDPERYTEVLRIYDGSNGANTKAFYQRLEALGPAGVVACNLMRAQKCSSRAKGYHRRSDKHGAYARKQWAMNNLCTTLTGHAAAIDITWGWKFDHKQQYHDQVLYIELPTGQASFHACDRGIGPDFTGEWDGKPDGSQSAILRFTADVLSSAPIP